MVISEYKPIGRYNDAGAKAAKENDRTHYGIIAVVYPVIRSFKTITFHLVIYGFWQVVKHPHSLVCMSRNQCYQP